jgi:hypothetical protein
MMTQTTLSDEGMVQWHRHSCLCAFAAPRIPGMSNAVASVPTEILIANLELEFELSHRKESLLKISNRKYFAVFSLARSAGSCVGSNRLPGTTTRSSTFLIYGSAIRIAHKYQQTRHLQISNRQPNRTFSVCRTACFSRCTNHSRDMIPAPATLK